MKRINIYIGEPQHKQFNVLAQRQGRPYSELIREALDQYLRRHGPQHQPKKSDRRRARTRRRS